MNNELPEKETEKIIPFTIRLKRIIYRGKIEVVKFLYIVKYKIFMREIRQSINRTISCACELEEVLLLKLSYNSE